MRKTRTNSSGGELLITVRRDLSTSLHGQIEASIRDAIRAGRLRQGTALPPTRLLAADLGVSRGVVVEAYQQLVAEGYLNSQTGGYTEVAATPTAIAGRRRSEAAPKPPPRKRDEVVPPRISFGYGRADVSNFPRTAWLRSIRRVITEAPCDRFGYLTGRGMPELHEAIAGYLNRVRGTAASAERIQICNGYGQGVGLIIQTLAAAGAKRLAVEDPSSGDDAVPVARAAGMDVVGVPVGDDGIDVDALTATDADAVVLTPSHQWPLGGVLSADARAALLEWAERRSALVIEDDYDAEYRYDRAPIGAMQGLAPDQVVYAGSTSKTLAPGLRIGWLVVPDRLVEPIAEAKVLADRGSPAIDQLAFADFLDRGEFDRHLRRMRPVYRRRRDALLAALCDRLPDFEPTGISAGIHLVAWLPPDLDEESVVAAAARRGVGISGVGESRISPGRAGLVFGYSSLNERAIGEGIGLLADAVADVRSRADGS
ncbi:MAG TPA: PLP-dependent aminotransferase family protein [Nocardioidaceae bacterium]|nr:PLP-dependent aminotransferase family protein [Nocardioidaceae bacterium]